MSNFLSQAGEQYQRYSHSPSGSGTPSGGYGSQRPPNYPTQNTPPVPRGWAAHLDQGSQRWYYVEVATGRTQWQPPNSGPPGPRGSQPPPSGPQNQYHSNQQPPPPQHASGRGGMFMAGAGGLAAGALGGAFLEHEWDKHKERQQEEGMEEREQERERQYERQHDIDQQREYEQQREIEQQRRQMQEEEREIQQERSYEREQEYREYVPPPPPPMMEYERVEYVDPYMAGPPRDEIYREEVEEQGIQDEEQQIRFDEDVNEVREFEEDRSGW